MNALHHLWDQLLEETLKSGLKSRKGGNNRWRPKLHIAPPAGWLNDPNGLCQYQGVYHAFYQFSPFETKGGLKFWGHCTSRDLLHWKFEGVPLVPDQPWDCHGVYSGSALVEDGRMYLYYTGNIKEEGDHDYICTGRRSSTMLAVSEDGRTVAGKELLLANTDYPADLTCHVRDPKVWKQDNVYYMVQGARTREDKGVVLLFSSRDKRHWENCGRLETEEAFGYMWECPDIYTLPETECTAAAQQDCGTQSGEEYSKEGQGRPGYRTILSISPQGLKQEGLHYANVYQSGTCFLTGDFREKPGLEAFRELDGGFDFYAPQTFLAEDGRRIQIAWMGVPDTDAFYTNRTVEDGWQHMMTIPRELSLRRGRICQNPVRELQDWWNQSHAFEGGFREAVDPCCQLDVETGGGDIRIILADGLELSYNRKEKIFRMEFTDPSLGAGRILRGRELEELDRLRILMDVSSVEVFLNEGEDVFTTRFYPEGDSIRVHAEGGKCRGTYYFHTEEAEREN